MALKKAAKKTAKEAPAKKAAKRAPPGKGPKPKYGVPEAAKELGIQPASVRVAFRKAKIEKNENGVYGWESEKDFKSAIKRVQSSGE